MVNYLCTQCNKVKDESEIILCEWESFSDSGFNAICKDCYNKEKAD